MHSHQKKKKLTKITSILFFLSVAAIAQPGTADEPIRYAGEPKLVDQAYHDGQLRPAVGVHSYQIMRANATHGRTEGARHGYNHSPMLAYWNDTYFVQYVSSQWNEHGIPTQVYLTQSKDGIAWEDPRMLFPAIEYAPGKQTIATHRMGFYTATNGRLLAMSFYGIPVGPTDSPNTGFGVGRGIREIYRDGSLGPIYFIRVMPHAGYDEKKAAAFYPMYTASPDAGFKAACEALLADKLVVQQWWEEDRPKDDFYALDPTKTPLFAANALSFYHRKDGKTVGLWKNAWAALADPEGKAWTTPVQIASKPTSSSKEWGQRTDDGRYAIAYDPMPKTSFRYPLAVITSDDGIVFDSMLVVQTEVPPGRYFGKFKERGSNYVRGIAEGNGNPPGNAMPLVYSMNKEDVWISHVPVPVTGKVTKAIDEDFENENSLDQLNIYAPVWAPVSRAMVESHNWVLKLSDANPYDYAKVVQVFPETQKVTIEFRLNLHEMDLGRFEIDVLDKVGNRAVMLEYDG